jgi:hypothetical protein
VPTTTDKDFKVKNGLIVGLGGSFGGTVEVSTPVYASDAATKQYVDDLIAGVGSVVVSDTAPATPENGDLWFDTVAERLKIYYETTDWLTLASIADTQNIPDHIHDTAIDGTGQIISIFWDGDWYNSPTLQTLDGGIPGSVSWDFIFDGGTV